LFFVFSLAERKNEKQRKREVPCCRRLKARQIGNGVSPVDLDNDWDELNVMRKTLPMSRHYFTFYALRFTVFRMPIVVAND
jgi:hypothetical protein